MNPNYGRISERAGHRCEYCHAPEVVFNFPFEVEHIIPIARQGSDQEDNLALACRSCNLRKGSRISGQRVGESQEIPLFHPRQQRWSEHFGVEENSAHLIGLTAVGEITVEYLGMNSPAQLAARQLWIRLGMFP